MLKYLKYQLLIILVIIFIIFSSITLIFNIFINLQKNNIQSFTLKVTELKSHFYKIYNNTYLLINQKINYVETDNIESRLIYENKEIFKTIEKDLIDVYNHLKKRDKSRIEKNFNEINHAIKRYESLFDSLIYLLTKRGNVNYGLIGELLDYSKEISNSKNIDIETKNILSEFENIYFFEKNKFREDSFIKVCYTILEKNKDKKSYSIINNYLNTFQNIINIEKKLGIGLYTQITIIKELDKHYLKIEKSIGSLLKLAENKKQINEAKVILYYIFFLVLMLTIIFIISLFITKYFMTGFNKLTEFLRNLGKNNFRFIDKYEIDRYPEEIANVYKELRNFVALLILRERQRDRALKRAEENEKRYRELADLLPQSIFEIDNLGNFTYVNKSWYKNFLYTPDDLKEGLNIIETLVYEGGDSILSNVKFENSSFIAIRKDGSVFPASVYTDFIIKDDHIAGKRGIIIDVTERNAYIKALQEEMKKAKNADKLKSSFLANMSHEIRTPMNAIIGFSNLLIKEDLTEEQKNEFAYYIRSSGELLLNLIDDIIDIAKIEAGQLKIHKKDCNLNELLEELKNTIINLKNQHKKENIDIVLLKFHEDIIIKTDPFRLKQILNNLLINALKYTEKGYIKFGVFEKDRELEFFVSDTGVGLTREELGKIFSIFERTKFSEEKNISGTGLGLAISKNLVELMGGNMWVDSTPGVGTTFYFTLPFIKSGNQKVGLENNISLNANFNWNDKTILLLEDDDASVLFYKELFKTTECKLIHSKKGWEALNIIKNNKIDLILLDIHLPDINGLELAKIIKEKYSIPIIAQTAFAMSGDKELCIESGCDDYMAKPVDTITLLNKIHKLLFFINNKENENISINKSSVLNINNPSTN